MTRVFPASTLAIFASLTAAQADDVFVDDVIVQSDLLCLGNDCIDGEPLLTPRTALLLKDGATAIRFEDTSTAAGLASRDWQLNANETGTNGADAFYLGDLGAGTTPFWVAADAASNSLYVSTSSRIGIGTSMPTSNLHIIDTSAASLKLEDTDGNWQIQTSVDDNALVFRENNFLIPFRISEGAPSDALFIASDGAVGLGTAAPAGDLHIRGGGQPTIVMEDTSGTALTWQLEASNIGFGLRDATNGTLPVYVEDAAPTYSLFVAGSGNVGIGSSTASAPLEVTNDDTFSFFRITATDAAVNNSVDITFTGGPLGTGQLRYNIVDGDNQEMSLDANGNMVLDGTLTTAGPTCAGGCDRVFDADYPLPSIAEYSGQMFANGYLPQIGPTRPGEPVNLTEQNANMLNALEHAHIYIAQLEANQKALIARIDALEGYVSSP